MFSNKNSYIQFSFRMTRQGLPRSSVEMSVMDMERRGGHTQATEIIQLLNKEEDMMKEAILWVDCQKEFGRSYILIFFL